MLANVSGFNKWRKYREGGEHSILVFSNQKNLAYFTMTKVLNCRQVRWAQELAGYDFKIVYRPRNLKGSQIRYLGDRSIVLGREIAVKMGFNRYHLY
jgi:hypothetical protein